jgi:hypothetical protein
VRLGELLRIAAIAVPVAALVGGAAAVVGVDVPHAVAVGALVLAACLVLFAQRSVVAAADLEPPEPDPPAGGRRDVEQLAWSMVEHRTHIRGIVIARVRAIAAHRLAEHGLDLGRSEDDAAIAALLGADAWAVLRPDRDRPVSPRAFDAALRAVELLPPPEPLGPVRAVPEDRTSRAD